MKRAAIFDVDGTLSDCTHRRHFVERKPADWKSFLRPDLVMLDTVIEPVAQLARYLANEFNEILIVTGRDEAQRHVTEKWLAKNDIPYGQLLMRRDGDYRPDEVVKEEILERLQKEFNIWLVLDDRSRVVSMWRKHGLVCLQAADGDF